MGGAIVRGLVDAGTVPNLAIADRDAGKQRAFADLGCSAHADVASMLDWLRATEAAPGDGVLVVGCKPQGLPETGPEIAKALQADSDTERLVISIVAGVTAEAVRQHVGSRSRIVRIMPNTPVAIRRGCSALVRGSTATNEDATLARTLFEAVGLVIEIDEAEMDAFSITVGSGPAYVFLLAELLADAGAAAGLDRVQALQAIIATTAGAADMLAASSETPEQLRANVTSPGGMTARAIETLDDAGIRDAFVRAVEAGRDRGRELSRS